MDYSIKGFGGGFAALVTGGLTLTGVKEFASGTFQRAFTDWYVMDLILAVSIMLFIFSLILIAKDIGDGEGWDRYERKSAIRGLTIGILLISAAWVTAAYTGSVTLTPDEDVWQDEFKYSGGAAAHTVAVTPSGQFVSIAGDSANDQTILWIRLNRTIFTEAYVRNIRGFTMNLTDDGISRVQFAGYNFIPDPDEVATFLDSDNGDIDIVDQGTTTGINATFGLTEILTWFTDYTYEDSGDYFSFILTFGADYAENSAQTLTFYWHIASDSDAIYYLVLFLMAAGFAYPFVSVFSLTNRSYRRRRR